MISNLHKKLLWLIAMMLLTATTAFAIPADTEPEDPGDTPTNTTPKPPPIAPPQGKYYGCAGSPFGYSQDLYSHDFRNACDQHNQCLINGGYDCNARLQQDLSDRCWQYYSGSLACNLEARYIGWRSQSSGAQDILLREYNQRLLNYRALGDCDNRCLYEYEYILIWLGFMQRHDACNYDRDCIKRAVDDMNRGMNNLRSRYGMETTLSESEIEDQESDFAQAVEQSWEEADSQVAANTSDPSPGNTGDPNTPGDPNTDPLPEDPGLPDNPDWPDTTPDLPFCTAMWEFWDVNSGLSGCTFDKQAPYAPYRQAP